MSCSAPSSSVTDAVKEYYGKTLRSTCDIESDACSAEFARMDSALPEHVREAMASISKHVTDKYYGCGLVVHELVQGCKVLDLGSGCGRDCFILSKLVGPEGHVTGLDMTDEMWELSRANIQYHTELFGHKEPNVHFVKGYMEDLQGAGLQDGVYDIVISNGAVNLCGKKEPVIQQACNALKEGGEFYISDVFTDVDIPEETRKNKLLWGQCIAGAIYWRHFLEMASHCGFSAPRLVSSAPVNITNPDMQRAVGDAKFVSATYRMFKLPSNRLQEGHVVYNGGVKGLCGDFKLDHWTHFRLGQPVWVDGELATILTCSRFRHIFSFKPRHQAYKDERNPFLAVNPQKNGCVI